MKTIVNVTFKTLLNEENLKSTTFRDMPILAEIPGLVTKTFYVNPNTGYLGAIYQFEHEKDADFYLNSSFFKDLESRYKIVNGSLSVEKAQITFVLQGLNTASSSLAGSPE